MNMRESKRYKLGKQWERTVKRRKRIKIKHVQYMYPLTTSDPLHNLSYLLKNRTAKYEWILCLQWEMSSYFDYLTSSSWVSFSSTEAKVNRRLFTWLISVHANIGLEIIVALIRSVLNCWQKFLLLMSFY